ncbi:unnamed protein product [Pleuronectes platessa]|uniref:Uncharacterized protein n=1 Tax=Pleuronectes platessa TaxID=8262 RepID=A0A9N7UGJ5_PLEPL|nr:unnamed protein product [Pleuronectes platessa]
MAEITQVPRFLILISGIRSRLRRRLLHDAFNDTGASLLKIGAWMGPRDGGACRPNDYRHEVELDNTREEQEQQHIAVDPQAPRLGEKAAKTEALKEGGEKEEGTRRKSLMPDKAENHLHGRLGS